MPGFPVGDGSCFIARPTICGPDRDLPWKEHCAEALGLPSSSSCYPQSPLA